MNIAEQLRQEQRENGNLSKVKDGIINIIKEQIHKGMHGVVISFERNTQEGKTEYCRYNGNEWWSVNEKHRIPLTEYLKSEGFVVKTGPLYCENIEVTL